MRAIAEACAARELDARVGIVVAPKSEVPAVDTARELHLPVAVLDPASPNYEDQLLEELERAESDLICLAGYLRLLPSRVLATYPGRILNIHPSLLPKHGGKGMYGMRVHQSVLNACETESGCTVHLVNERYDEGEILLQLSCRVLPDDTPETLAARVLDLEHRAYVTALRQVIQEHGRKRQTNPAV